MTAHPTPWGPAAPQQVPLPVLVDLFGRHFDWAAWERLLRARRCVVERPRRSRHPRHPEIVYPIDYGYVPDTLGTDGEAVDIFLGTGETGLAALILTDDHRRGDREVKLLYDCSPEEIYLVNGFINYAPDLMQGRLVMRREMGALWRAAPGG